MASTRLGYLAIKKETTAAVAVKPTHFLRFKEGDIMAKKEVIENNPIQNNRWNAINAVPGKIATAGNYKVDLDTIESVHFLYGTLGGISSADVGSTAGQVYEHTLTMTNSLPSFTIEQGKGNLTDATGNLQNYQVDRAFGCMVDKLKLSAQDGIIAMEVDFKACGVFQRALLINNASAGASVNLALDTVEGLVAADIVNIYDTTPQNETDAIVSISTTNKTIQIATLGASYTVAKDAKVELTPQTPSYGSTDVYSFAHVNFQFGADLTAAASAAETNIENWELTYDNQLEERYGSLRSSPAVIAPKGAMATLKFTKYFENVVDRDKYLALKKQACIMTITNNTIIGASDTNNYKYTIKTEISDLRYTTAEMPTGTDDLYAVKIEGTCFYDATDGRAFRMLIKNNAVGTTYTA